MKQNRIPITGAKVHSYSVRTVKEEEKLRIVLEINVDDITSDMGDVQKALLTHKQGDYEVGLNVLSEQKSSTPVSDDSDDFGV